MTIPFSHGHASLDNLPIELLTRIYSYIVTGSNVRLIHTSSGGGGDDNDQTSRPCQNFQSVRLVSKSLYSTSALLSQCALRYATLAIHSQEDILAIQNKLGPAHLRLVRNVCLCAELRRARDKPRCRTVADRYLWDPNCTEVPYWLNISVAHLAKLFPNLRVLSLRQAGTHINTFRHDLSYTLEDLLAATKHTAPTPPEETSDVQSTRNSLPISFNDSDPVDDTAPPFSPFYAGEAIPTGFSDRELATEPKQHEHMPKGWIPSDFSHSLYTCMKNTAPRYGKKWYYNFIQDAVRLGVEIIFDLELLFYPSAVVDGFSQSDVDPDSWTMIENAQVSTKDWILRFSHDGRHYAFPQSPAELDWDGWLTKKQRDRWSA